MYSSSLKTWRAARDRGEIAGLAPKKWGPKGSAPDPRDRELAANAREIARLSARVERAEAIIGLQKYLRLLIASRPCRERDRVIAMVAARILEPHNKLATKRWWHTTTLAEDLHVSERDHAR